MTNFAKARRTMVDNQLRTNDVTDLRIIDAFDAVPRELFVPQALRPLAYIDEHLQVKAGDGPTGGRYLMQPAPLARMIQLADIVPSDKVLIVGGGTGYAAAIVARLTAAVTVVDQDADLVAAATKAWADAGVSGITAVVAEPTAGAPQNAPYDVILVDGAVEVLPDALAAQLAEGGRLIAVEGQGLAGRVRIRTRSGEGVSARTAFNCAARPLPGYQKTPEFVF
jgi:protein-L-isoaspartate(D-aspartate) O-methyltransferase